MKAENRRSPLWLMMVSLALLLACDATVGPMRATSFPADLTYMSPERLKTAMWVLAAEIQELEKLLEHQDQGDEPIDRKAARGILARMKVAAKTLEEAGRSTQHPVINDNLDVFIGRLDRADRALDREPPDFFPASTIAGSCYLCHGQTKATATNDRRPVPHRG